MEKTVNASIFEGRVIILRALKTHSKIQPGLTILTDALAEIITCEETKRSPGVYLFIDISGYEIVSSTFLGIIGSYTADDFSHIKVISLCGASDAVVKRLQQFRIIPVNGDGTSKVKVCQSIPEGLLSIIP